MTTPTATVTALERELLGAARRGDQEAYRRLVEPHRGELHAHCYRMLGSVHDAEDALQDALLRAWRGLPRFEGRSSLRSWLYRIATNACLNAVERRPKRVLPIDHGPAADPHDVPGTPLVESTWVEPYPDERLGLEDGRAGPEARYERRESVELAFVAALQHLPPNQRAVLILREVLGFSGQEIAEALETTVAAVNSAMQRARKAVDERLPERSQQATLRALGDQRCARSSRATWTRGTRDVDTVVDAAQDAVWSMPPLASWYRGATRSPASWPPRRSRRMALALPAGPRQRAGGVGKLRLGRREQTDPVRARRVDPAWRPHHRDHLLHHADDPCPTASELPRRGPTSRPTRRRLALVLRGVRPSLRLD